MIFPRTRRARVRYQRHKVVAVLVTFAIGWGAWKLLPADRRPLLHWPFPALPTPQQAFDSRESGISVEAVAVVERILPDSLAPGEMSALPRLRMRSRQGHPFTLLGGPAAAPGDTLRVGGRYRWDPAGGTVVARVERP